MKILVVFAYPRFETSIVQRKLLDTIRGIPDVTINDLYYPYPDFHIDVEAEKARLLQPLSCCSILSTGIPCRPSSRNGSTWSWSSTGPTGRKAQPSMANF